MVEGSRDRMALHRARQADADGCCRIALSAQNAAFSTTFVLSGRVRHREVAAVYAASAFSACAQWRRPRYASIREAGKCDTNRCKPVDRKPCTVRSRFRSGTCECSTRSSAPCASDARLAASGSLPRPQFVGGHAPGPAAPLLQQPGRQALGSLGLAGSWTISSST